MNCLQNPTSTWDLEESPRRVRVRAQFGHPEEHASHATNTNKKTQWTKELFYTGPNGSYTKPSLNPKRILNQKVSNDTAWTPSISKKCLFNFKPKGFSSQKHNLHQKPFYTQWRCYKKNLQTETILQHQVLQSKRINGIFPCWPHGFQTKGILRQNDFYTSFARLENFQQHHL